MEKKGHLAQKCTHQGGSAITQRQQTPIVITQQANYTCPSLFPASNPMLSQTITAETPTTSEIWQTLIEQLKKANQDDNLLKRHIKKKAEQSQVLVAKVAQQNQTSANKSKD